MKHNVDHNEASYYGASVYYVEIVLLVAIVVLLVIKRKRQNKSGGKREVPTFPRGHPLLPRIGIIESFYNLFLCHKDGLGYLDMLARECGHFLKLTVGYTPSYCVSDPNIIQKLVTSTDPGHLNKAGYFYDKLFQGALNDGLVASDISIWTPHRKLLGKSFTYKSIQSYLGIINGRAKKLANDLLTSAKNTNGSVEGQAISDPIFFHTLKAISDIVIGAGICTDEEYREFNYYFRRYREIVAYRTLNPWLMIDPVWWLHPIRKELLGTLHHFDKFIKIVTQKYKEKKRQEEALGIKWVDVGDDEIGVKPFRCVLEEMLHYGMNDKEIRDEVITILTAGHETSALSVRYLLFHLAQYPEIQELCRQEVDNLFDSKIADSDYGVDLTMDDLASLKYLDRCLMESLRITPIIPLTIRRLDKPLQLDDGYEIEAGRNVFMLIWNLHHNSEHFPNPLKFDPDRFLPENCLKRHQYAFLPFSGGVRNCIGWKMALTEIKIIAVWILRNFESFTTDKLEHVKFLFDISLLPDKPIHLLLKKRIRLTE